MKKIITLSWPEMILSGNVGIMRQVSALQRLRPEAYGAASNGLDAWVKHIHGAMAENVISKMLNIHWSGTVGDTKMPDMIYSDGTLVGVRSTQRADGCLILHHKDADDSPFYLVITKSAPIFEVAGWLRARDGKLDQYWRDDVPFPAFFVPQGALHSVENEEAVA